MSVRSSQAMGIGFFCLHLSVSCLNDVLFKLLGQSLPAIQVTFMRFFFATITLVFVALVKNQSLKTKFLHIHALRGAILFTGMSLWCFGLSHTPLADAIIINFTIPIFLLIMCSMILREKVDSKRWLATLVTFIGILIVTKPVSTQFNPYSLIMIVTAAIFASCDILNKIYAQRESTFCSLFYTALFTTVFAALFLLIKKTLTGAPFIVIENSYQVGYTFLLGIGANLTFLLILKAFELIDASKTASLRYFELFLSALAGYIFFGEVPTGSTLLGAALVLPTTIFIIYHESQTLSTDQDRAKKEGHMQVA